LPLVDKCVQHLEGATRVVECPVGGSMATENSAPAADSRTLRRLFRAGHPPGPLDRATCRRPRPSDCRMDRRRPEGPKSNLAVGYQYGTAGATREHWQTAAMVGAFATHRVGDAGKLDGSASGCCPLGSTRGELPSTTPPRTGPRPISVNRVGDLFPGAGVISDGWYPGRQRRKLVSRSGRGSPVEVVGRLSCYGSEARPWRRR